jgi:hypothetical protein
MPWSVDWLARQQLADWREFKALPMVIACGMWQQLRCCGLKLE